MAVRSFSTYTRQKRSRWQSHPSSFSDRRHLSSIVFHHIHPRYGSYGIRAQIYRPRCRHLRHLRGRGHESCTAPSFMIPMTRRHKGRKPNFEIVPWRESCWPDPQWNVLSFVSPSKLGGVCSDGSWESPNNTIVVGKSSRALRAFSTDHKVPPEVNYRLEKVLYIDPSKEKERKEIEDKARQVRLRIAKVQFGVWYIRPESNSHGRTFSVEHEREFINQSAAYLSVVYERRLICIDVSTSDVMRLGY
jgi:hypothetical protein